MPAHVTSTTNAEKVARLESALAEMLAQTLRRGFCGTAAIELSIEDGTIQQIRRKVERIEE